MKISFWRMALFALTVPWVLCPATRAANCLGLAITEVMPKASIDGFGVEGLDWFEITWFGTEPLNLQGYGISDDNTNAVRRDAFDHCLIIGPEESILFVRTNAHASTGAIVDAFLARWGVTNLPAEVQVRVYTRPGLNGDTGGDQLWLWDPDGNPVTHVVFGEADRGRSFTYSHENGVFGTMSTPGVNKAFRAAAQTNDIGSPGCTTGRVPLSILVPPASQEVNGCDSVYFSVVGAGVPEPSYQWLSNGLPIPGATASFLVITNIPPGATEFRVVLENCFESITSAPAVLTLNSNPQAPVIDRPPADATVFPGQKAVFSVEARGFPCLQYQWYSNSVPVPDATNRMLLVQVPEEAMESTNDYCVVAMNELGTNKQSARLMVVRRPILKITEILAAPTNREVSGHYGWFELTNDDTNAVNLQGYRFRDYSNLLAAFTITNPVVIQPGESIVFVEDMTRDAFVRWWGAGNLPPGLQVITWSGWRVSSSGEDIIYLWNPAACDPNDTVANASFASATPGFSLELTNECFPMFGCVGTGLDDSREGVNGAFRAAEGGDIGSPGFTRVPHILNLALDEAGVHVRCRVMQGKNYQLVQTPSLSLPSWTPLPLSIVTAWTNVITLHDASAAPMGFYRVSELP